MTISAIFLNFYYDFLKEQLFILNKRCLLFFDVSINKDCYGTIIVNAI